MKKIYECTTVRPLKEVATIVKRVGDGQGYHSPMRRFVAATGGASLEWTNAPSDGGDHAAFYAMDAEADWSVRLEWLTRTRAYWAVSFYVDEGADGCRVHVVAEGTPDQFGPAKRLAAQVVEALR